MARIEEQVYSFTGDEKDVIVNALTNYHEALSESLMYGDTSGAELSNYLNDRLTIIEFLINELDPKGIYR